MGLRSSRVWISYSSLSVYTVQSLPLRYCKTGKLADRQRGKMTDIQKDRRARSQKERQQKTRQKGRYLGINERDWQTGRQTTSSQGMHTGNKSY